jgi:hypothetical protein
LGQLAPSDRAAFRWQLVGADLTMADVIAEARDTGQLALIPLADIA